MRHFTNGQGYARIRAEHYENYEDCLQAAAEDIAEEMNCGVWEVVAEWEDESTREWILAFFPDNEEEPEPLYGLTREDRTKAQEENEGVDTL